MEQTAKSDTDGFDTVSEVLEYLNGLTVDDTQTYYFYDMDADSVRRISSYAEPVTWADSTIAAITEVTTAEFLGMGGVEGTEDINTNTEIVTYYDDAGNTYGANKYFYDGTDVRIIATYTATVPEHERAIWEQIGDGGDIHVEILPLAADAEPDNTYVQEDDNTQWRVGSETVPEVPGSITKSTISPPDHDWDGALTADPTDGSVLDQVAYFKSDTGVFRVKPSGSLDGSLTDADLTPDTGITWLDVADTDPTNDARVAYYNTDRDRFRLKPDGATADAGITTQTAVYNGASGTFTTHTPRATDPTSVLPTGNTEMYYNTDDRIWRLRNGTINAGAWGNAEAQNIRGILGGSISQLR